MPVLASFDYAVIRVVPRVEWGECINVGIIMFCRTRRFLRVGLVLDDQRLETFAPYLDWESVRTHLAHMSLICEGGADSGAIGALSQAERFYWLVAPRSTIIQCSPVHSGLCSGPEMALTRLMEKMVG